MTNDTLHSLVLRIITLCEEAGMRGVEGHMTLSGMAPESTYRMPGDVTTIYPTNKTMLKIDVSGTFDDAVN